MTGATETPEPLRVRTIRTPLDTPAADMTAVYACLADEFGPEQVFLLESLAGPEQDCRTTVVGFGTVVTVSVTEGVLSLDGPDEVTARMRSRLRAGGLGQRPDGAVELPGGRELWDALRIVMSTFDVPGSSSEFVFGFLSFLSYDAVRYVEELPRLIAGDTHVPDVHLALPAGLIRVDVGTGRAELLIHRCAEWESPDPAEVRRLVVAASEQTQAVPVASAGAVRDEIDRDEYFGLVGDCLEHIAAGDIYQVQIGHEITIESQDGPLEVYRRLRERNPSPYGYLAHVAGQSVIGASPELFVRISDGTVTMRPIAGTIPCGGEVSEHERERLGRKLLGAPKEIAEHVMLVDLCRNDIGRICRPNTLDVPTMFSVEAYSHVLHLVSTVEGELEEHRDVFDVIAATFPAGTMTGAPKLRAMEIIESMEASRRGLYAGAIGLIDVGGFTNLALCIRTLIGTGDAYRARASAGIVADSIPDLEWRETLAKIGAAYWAASGEEL